MPSNIVAVGVRVAVAEHRAADGAVVAAAAVGPQDEDAAVAGLHGRDAGADRLDDAAALVAEHDGERGGGVAEHPVQVGVADAGRLDLEPDLAGAGVGELDLLQLERLVGREHDRCSGAHGARCYRASTPCSTVSARSRCARQLGDAARHVAGPGGIDDRPVRAVGLVLAAGGAVVDRAVRLGAVPQQPDQRAAAARIRPGRRAGSGSGGWRPARSVTSPSTAASRQAAAASSSSSMSSSVASGSPRSTASRSSSARRW